MAIVLFKIIIGKWEKSKTKKLKGDFYVTEKSRNGTDTSGMAGSRV